jgi:hypothetical protein
MYIIKGLFSLWIYFAPEVQYLDTHRADLNTQRASSKRIQNKNYNLNDFGT